MRFTTRALVTMGLLGAAVALAAGLALAVAPRGASQQSVARHASLLPVLHSTHSPTIITGPVTSSALPSSTHAVPPIRTLPWTQLTHDAAPPYISEATAQAIAMKTVDAMGGGHIIATTLETLTAAGRATGTTVSPPTVTRTRMVWLIWIVGTWQGGCLTTDCPSRANTLSYAEVDAKTGTSFGYGTSVDMPGAPPVGTGVHLGGSG